MNVCVFCGRTTKDVDLRYSNEMAIARTSLAVDDGFGDNKKTSFFNLTAFGKSAESMEKYVPKGTKIVVNCKAQQNNWKDKQGNNRTDIGFIVNSWEFAESKNSEQKTEEKPKPTDKDGFMQIPDGLSEELPFN